MDGSPADRTSPTADVAVLCWRTPAESDRRAHAIATFLGANARFVELTAGSGPIRTPVPRCRCLVVDAETLALAAEALPAGIGALESLTTDAADQVFVHGFTPADRHTAILQSLSGGGLLGVHPAPHGDPTFQVTPGHRDRCGQFSGLSFTAVNAAGVNVFTLGPPQQALDTLVRIDQRPFFVRVAHGRAQLFAVASNTLADLDEPVEGQASPLKWFSTLVPLIMFLRGALGQRLWHDETPRACFIIDDPPLKNRHGFLEYRRLVESMRRQKFSTCIAFIPWNYRRSRRDAAALFSSGPRVPALCVHGCDHTNGEFASADAASLRGKARLALERMRAHVHLSGVPFDDVMVFPQGLFSVEALSALKAAGYLAAVNTDLRPACGGHGLVLRDLLDVAVVKFANFPLFGRRYPVNLAEFAFDLFMGKPALAVEHHGYFRHGYTALESFVECLGSLDERLEWTSLGAICSRASMTRTDAQGDTHVRFFAGRFQMVNAAPRTRRYVLLRPHPPGAPLPAVSANGRACRVEQHEDHVKVALSLAPGQTADIQVISAEAEPIAAPVREPALHSAAVRIRRLLCDFRDNHVDTNSVLSAVAATARALRAPGPTDAPASGV